MADTDLRGDTVIDTLVNLSSEEMRGETAVATIANIVRDSGSDEEVPRDVIGAILMLQDAIGADGSNLFVMSTARDGYINDSGGYTGSVNDRHPMTTPLIPVKPGQSYVFQAWALENTAASGNNGNLWMVYAFYDSEGKAVGGRTQKYGGTTLSSGYAYNTYEITIPDGIAYLRVCSRRVLGGYAKLERGEEPTGWSLSPHDTSVALTEAPICTADNAVLMPPISATVYGHSSQATTTGKNLAPDTRDAYGLFRTSSADSGTVQSSGGTAQLGVAILVQPGESVTFGKIGALPGYFKWCDGPLEVGDTISGGASIANRNSYTLTNDGDAAKYAAYFFHVSSTSVTDESLRVHQVQVERGTSNTAYEPYSGGYASPSPSMPQPISSVDSVNLTLATRNLLSADAADWKSGGIGGNGLPGDNSTRVITLDGIRLTHGTYTLSVADGWKAVNVNAYNSNLTLLARFVQTDGSPNTFVVPAGTAYVRPCLGKLDDSDIGPSDVADAKPMLEVGTTAHAYEAYAPTTVTVDLDGHELRSLPDGTRDELTLGIDGHVRLVQRVGIADLGDLSYTYNSDYGYFITTPTGIASGTSGDVAMMCTTYSVWACNTVANIRSSIPDKSIAQRGSYATCYIKDSGAGTDPSAFALSMSGQSLIYALAEPLTIDLGPVPLPSLPSPTFTAFVGADERTTLAVTYVTNNS